MPIKDYALTLPVLVVGLVATELTWVVMDSQIHQAEQLRFNRYAERTIVTIQERLLEAGRGLFYASKSLEFDEWRAFVGAQHLEMYPGVLGFGCILPVQRANKTPILPSEAKAIPWIYTSSPKSSRWRATMRLGGLISDKKPIAGGPIRDRAFPKRSATKSFRNSLKLIPPIPPHAA